MAKKAVAEMTVQGKYANAVIVGCELTQKVKTLQEELGEFREVLLDKTVKVPEGEQSVRLLPIKGIGSVLLALKRKVTIKMTDALKDALDKGRYADVLKVKRGMSIKNPADIQRAKELLLAAGIECEETVDVKVTAAELDKYYVQKGKDELLGDAIEMTEIASVEFEI